MNLKFLPLFLIVMISCSTEPSGESDTDFDTPTDQNDTTEEIPSDDEDDYYTSPRSYAVAYNLQTHYGVDSSFATDDSAALQQAIDDAWAAGGGKIIIPEGEYSFADIALRSNIHIEISSSATIRPTEKAENAGKNYTIFIGQSGSAEPLENISISSYGGGKFTFDLRYAGEDYKSLRCILLSNVQNFELSNICIEDNNTVFAALGFTGETIDGVVYGPTGGVVKEIENYNSEYGYGTVQIQYGCNILYKNLYGLGGVTLRLESHLTTYYETDCIGYIDGIVGRNISCENGHAAVMLSPHFLENGWVDVRGIDAVACETALLIEGGFVTDEQAEYGLEPGFFSAQSAFRNITATFSATEAQVHPKHFKYMVEELVDLLPSTSPYEAKSGPSIAVIYYTAPYAVDCSVEDIDSAEGFLESQYLIFGEYETKEEYYI